MAQYIDKSAFVAEIEKLKDRHKNHNTVVGMAYNMAYNDILSSINTLEVKEVDLDGERRKYLTEHFNVYEDGILLSKRSNLPLETYDAIKIAKHFFELGLSVNNPVTAADRGTAEEIIINLKRVEQDYHIDLTKEIEWVRNKVKKGE